VARALIGAIVIALNAAGCAETLGRDDGAVQVMVFGEPEELRAYRDLVAAFSEEEPDIRVQLVEASDRADLIARISTSIAGGSPPDLFLLNYRFYGQFAARGVLEPLEDRVDASQAFSQDDFFPQALEAFRWDGVLTCLPQNISSLVVYYNRDLLAEANLPEPEDDWTWAGMVGRAVELTKDDDGDGTPEQYGLGLEPSLIRLAPFVWSNGGEVVDDDENPTRLTLGSPESLQAMTEFFRLGRELRVVPSELEREAEDEESRFMNGRLAMLLSSRRSTPTFRTITDFEWDIAPLPRMREAAGILHSDAYCMTRASDRKDDAWRFLEFALGPEGQRITARSGRTVPSLREVAESDAFLDPTKPPSRSRVFLDTIPFIRRVPTISTWPEIEDATESLIEFGLYDDVPAPEIAQRLFSITQPFFDRAER
jgi:multiple sugar transport system substrate-binding protein